MSVRNAGSTSCTRDVGQAALELRVSTASGTPVWSSDDCAPGGPHDVVTLKPNQIFRTALVWSRTTSKPGCPTGQPKARGGQLHAQRPQPRPDQRRSRFRAALSRRAPGCHLPQGGARTVPTLNLSGASVPQRGGRVAALGPVPVRRDGEKAPESLPLKVVVVAGTQVRQRQLERLLSGPGHSVAGGAKDAAQAEILVSEVRPERSSSTSTCSPVASRSSRASWPRCPTPIVVCGSAAEHAEAALAAGAVDVVGGLDVPPASPAYGDVLRRHLSMASRVRVITHPRARLRGRSRGIVATAPAGRRPAGAQAHLRRRGRRLHRRPAGARHAAGRAARRPASHHRRRPAHGRGLRRGPGPLARRSLPAACGGRRATASG